MKQAIAYYRVSTREQGDSGLGLEAQQAAVRAFARQNGYEIVDRYKEVETGKRADRPQLRAAIEACRKGRAVLVVAKLDRLARNVAFTSALMDSGIEFVCVDNPHATRLTIHILAAVAEDEARRIGERTKAALEALKDRGVKLGNSTKALRQKATQANVQKSQNFRDSVRDTVEAKRRAKWTLQRIADHLNGRGVTTRRGGKWSATAVMRVLN